MSESRARTSCEPCRKRKIKCDASLPCSSCVLRKLESSCHFHSDKTDTSPRDHASGSASAHSPDRPPKRRKPVEHEAAESHSLADLQTMKASARQIQAHIESLERKLEANVAETHDPEERDNWRRVKAVIPEREIVEVLLEYLLQECDWLWQCRDIVSLWKSAIARSGISSALAGILCMSLAIPCLFLGPYQTPFYKVPLDTSKLHSGLFATAQTFITGGKGLDELELLQILATYSVYHGRNDLIDKYLSAAMNIVHADGWLDENSEVWRDLDGDDRQRARLVLAELVSAQKYVPDRSLAYHRWNLLMTFVQQRDMRVNLCRPFPPTTSLQASVRLSLPGSVDLPLRVLRIRSNEELRMGRIYRELLLDFSDVLPGVRRLLNMLAVNTAASTEEALAQSGRLQRELQDWRTFKLPSADLRLPQAHEIDLESPLSCHRAARALLLHSAVTCVEGIVTRHWLSLGRVGIPLQQFLHDECLLNAQRSFDSIPIVRALLETRHAPFVSTFVICGLFNAATCFAIPLIRVIQARSIPRGMSDARTEERIHNLPFFPELMLSNPSPLFRSSVTVGAHAQYDDVDIKRYANNILVVLDMLSVLNALPCGQLAQDQLETLVQHFDLRSAPTSTRYHNSTATWSAPDFSEMTDVGNGDYAAALTSGVPSALDPFPGMWDELLQLDPSVWEVLLKGEEPGHAGLVM